MYLISPVSWKFILNFLYVDFDIIYLNMKSSDPHSFFVFKVYKTRTTIVVSNGRYTFYQIAFIQYLLSNMYNLSNTIYQISFIKYHLSNTFYQIPFIKYYLQSNFFLMNQSINESMNESINRVLLERHICR